jgi:hypothetical protein
VGPAAAESPPVLGAKPLTGGFERTVLSPAKPGEASTISQPFELHRRIQARRSSSVMAPSPFASRAAPDPWIIELRAVATILRSWRSTSSTSQTAANAEAEKPVTNHSSSVVIILEQSFTHLT